MPFTTHRRTGLSLIPQRVGGATEIVTQPLAAVHALRPTPARSAKQPAAFEAVVAPLPRGTIRETIVGIGMLPDTVRSRTFDRAVSRETVKFTSPVSSEPTGPQSLEDRLDAAVSAVAARPSNDWPRSRAPRREPVRGSEPERSPAAAAAPAARTPNVAAASAAAPSVAAPSVAAPSVAAPSVGATAAESAAPAGLFRSAAIDARQADAFGPELGVNVKGRSWSLLLLILSLVTLSFAGAGLASVEVTAEAQGVLRAPNGLRPVASVLAGAVTEVQVESGDAVEASQLIARLEATELRASLEARLRELELVRDDVTRSERHDELLEAESARALVRRRAALRERIEVNAERRDQRQARDQSLAALVRDGGASRAEGLAAKEALQDATEQVSSLSNELALLDLESADRARQAQERQSARKNQLGRAEAGVAEARTLLAATEIRAPAAGRVESLLVGPGAVIPAGGVLGHIVPNGSPRTITAFVQSREIAFVQAGAPASVEVQSLSVSEFGLARARVTRVSTDVATAAEVQSTLGEAPTGQLVRVELELLDSSETSKMDALLRSGERVKIRLHRRERRLITLLFDFVRRWVS